MFRSGINTSNTIQVKIRFEIWKLNFFFIFVICLLKFSTSIGYTQTSKIDSLLRIVENGKNDSNTAKTLAEISLQYYKSTDFATAAKYAKKTMILSEKINYQSGLALAHYRLSAILFTQGDFTEALPELYSSLKIYEKLKAKKGISACYSYIGRIYVAQQNFTEALAIYNKILALYTEIRNVQGISITYNLIGNIYYDRGLYDSALVYYTYSLNNARSIDHQPSIATALLNIGNLFIVQGNYTEAMRSDREALEIYRVTGEHEGVCACYINIGDLFLKQKKYSDALIILDSARVLAQRIGNKQHLESIYYSMANRDSAMGNFRSALNNYKIHILYHDSLINDENTKKTVASQMQYEFDKQQTADSVKNAELSKQENLKHDQEIKQQQLYTWGGGIGFALMLVVAGVSFRAYRNKQKANEIIALQKELVEEKQKEILDSIYYARRIQRSLLPTESYISRALKRSGP